MAEPLRVLTFCAVLLGSVSYPAIAYEPAVNYMLQCMGCHAPKGEGEPGRVPSLRDTLVPFASIADGRKFLVQVPGAAQSTLSDAELAELLNWMIQTLSTAPPSGTLAHYTAAEVARYRRTPLINVRAMRNRLFAQLSASRGGSAPIRTPPPPTPDQQ
ncbi:MAG TPA: hypothetical protein VFB37_12835 [Steroidobacteraceae bacterium]|nr:hypothetical protein [Steroidobacteraceae bacterium]